VWHLAASYSSPHIGEEPFSLALAIEEQMPLMQDRACGFNQAWFEFLLHSNR